MVELPADIPASALRHSTRSGYNTNLGNSDIVLSAYAPVSTIGVTLFGKVNEFFFADL